MELQDALQALIDKGDWGDVALYYLDLLPMRPDLPALDQRHLLGALLLLVLWQWLLLLRRRLRKPRIPWRLGKVTIDLRGGQQTIHSVLGGSSGNGKSTALLSLLQLDKPVAAIGFDDSKPLQDWWTAHEDDDRYIHWRPDGTIGWDILSGPAQTVAEALTAGFERSSNDTGYFRGLVGNRLSDLIEADDASGKKRDLWSYVDRLRTIQGYDGDTTRACRRWANSFETLLKNLGPSLGTDFNLTDAMRQGKKVLLLPNNFLRPESAQLIGGIGLVQARRAAAETGNFLLFIEEAGQATRYTTDIAVMFQAGRTRGCPTVLITQNMSALKPQVTNNVKAWVVFGQETKKEAEAAAEQVWNEPDDFLGLPVGTCWVRAPGVPTTRVRLPLVKPKPRRNQSVRLAPQQVPIERSYSRVNQLSGAKVLALPAPVVPVPSWVGQYEVRQRCFEKMVRSREPGLLWTPERGFWQDGPCLLWTGAKRNNGTRPAFKDEDGKTKTVYIEVYKWAGGVIPASWEIDHLCGQPLCCEHSHHEAVTTEENIRRRDGRKKALASLAA